MDSDLTPTKRAASEPAATEPPATEPPLTNRPVADTSAEGASKGASIRRSPLLAIPVALGYVLVAVGKWQDGILTELLWMCHLATVLLFVGLAVDHLRLILVGTLIHVAAGWYVYLLDAFLRWDTTLTSFVSHILSPAIGLWACRGRGPMPPWTAWIAWSVMLASMVLAWLFADPALNVNQTDRAWIPGDPRSGAVLWGTNLLTLLAAAFLGEAALRRWVGTPKAPLSGDGDR